MRNYREALTLLAQGIALITRALVMLGRIEVVAVEDPDELPSRRARYRGAPPPPQPKYIDPIERMRNDPGYLAYQRRMAQERAMHGGEE